MNYRQKLELFERIQASYGGFLKAVLWKLTAERDLFAEAMQNALLAIWRNIEKLDDSNCGSYLYRIAQTAVSKAWRKRAGNNGDFLDDLIGNEKTSIEKATEGEMMQIVRQRIAELPAKQARAIMMRYLEVKDYNRIASELKCSEQTARSHVSKALMVLKRNLTDE